MNNESIKKFVERKIMELTRNNIFNANHHCSTAHFIFALYLHDFNFE